MKKKIGSFLSLLIALCVVFFAGAMAIASSPDLTAHLAATFHISVDTLTAFVQFFGGSTPGVTMAVCTLTGWTESCDEDGNIAGVAALYITGNSDITEVTYNVNGEVTAITNASGKAFVKWEFPEDVGFFNQPVAVNRGNIFIKQVIQITNYKQRTALRNAVANLLNCSLCGVIGVLVDNNGKAWVVGIKKTASGYIVKGLKAVSSDGGKSGTVSESDSNELTIQLESKAGELAREFAGDLDDLLVAGS